MLPIMMAPQCLVYAALLLTGTLDRVHLATKFGSDATAAAVVTTRSTKVMLYNASTKEDSP